MLNKSFKITFFKFTKAVYFGKLLQTSLPRNKTSQMANEADWR